jgi:translation elongation factor EF-Tu-like GTPase
VQYRTVNEQVFHFRIEAAHANTGRGTVNVGIITAGIVRVGDPLDLHHAGSMQAVSCRGVEFADDVRRSRERPPLFGLLIPGLEPADVSAGDELSSPSMSD